MSLVFSDYEIDQLGIKFEGAEAYQSANCIGSLEEEMESKTITKSCRGVVVKERTRGTGRGTLKIKMHLPWDIYNNIYGMNLEGLIEGVKAYGANSRHKNFGITTHVLDEDGNEKLKAYPNCAVRSGKTAKTENGAEEVAEVELEVAVCPDDYGNGVYEALVSELTDENVINTWMNAFEPELVQKVSG